MLATAMMTGRALVAEGSAALQLARRCVARFVTLLSLTLECMLGALAHWRDRALYRLRGYAIERRRPHRPSVFVRRALIDDAKRLYLNEKYLRVVRLSDATLDSKNIVDRSTKRPVREVLRALRALDERDPVAIAHFVATCLHEPGREISRAILTDWTSAPALLDELRAPPLRAFAAAVNAIWLELYKQYDYRALSAGGLVSSHLPMKHPFMVPGGRFIEMYYWDNYWILEGLLICGMYKTARQLIENHIYLIDSYGFVPNGSRVYYLNRSQPPYFAQMTLIYDRYCSRASALDADEKRAARRFVLDEALVYMQREYEFWMSERSVWVRARWNGKDIGGKLNVFRANTCEPRPESYFEDVSTARNLASASERTRLYTNIATATESGYDFSSRWLGDPQRLDTMQTVDLIPVDLNAILYKTERILCRLHALAGHARCARKYRALAVRRKLLVNTLLWSRDKQCWADYNVRTARLNDGNAAAFYLSNLAPLWNGIKPPMPWRIGDYLGAHEPLFTGARDAGPDGQATASGVPYSSVKSAQQWDCENVWPPNQHQLVTMLVKYGRRDLALGIARKFFSSVYQGWLRTGMIYEKYNARVPGERGSGGEYAAQAGFGWSNGVILALIQMFKDELIVECTAPQAAVAAADADDADEPTGSNT